MNNTLRVASIFTWINMIFFGVILLFGLLMALVLGGFPILAGLFLASSIPLNCYASLQLHKSIRHPAIKLSNQTPVGIRFVGFIALFMGITMFGQGVGILQNAPEFLKSMQSMQSQFPTMKGAPSYSFTLKEVYLTGILPVILGLSISLNIFLNFRLLRWYYLVRQSDVS